MVWFVRFKGLGRGIDSLGLAVLHMKDYSRLSPSLFLTTWLSLERAVSPGQPNILRSQNIRKYRKRKNKTLINVNPLSSFQT